jgi:hypothetical protein
MATCKARLTVAHHLNVMNSLGVAVTRFSNGWRCAKELARLPRANEIWRGSLSLARRDAPDRSLGHGSDREAGVYSRNKRNPRLRRELRHAAHSPELARRGTAPGIRFGPSTRSATTRINSR